MAKTDKTPWLLACCIALALSSVSALTLHSPVQAAPSGAPASAAPPMPSAPQESLDAGDRAELLEHWDNPKYAREERRQCAGLVVLLAATAGFSLRRKRALRRGCRHV